MKCSVPGCTNYHKNCSMFKFPKDVGRRRIWMKNARRKLATWHRICEFHFDKNQFHEVAKGARKKLKPNAVPTIFHHFNNRRRKKPLLLVNMKNFKSRENRAEVVNSDLQFRIMDYWSENDRNNAKEELINAIFEDSCPPKENPLESEKQTANGRNLGLENIPVIDNDALDESNIEFSFSTPKKLKDLTPIFTKWSPKIKNVVSITEEVIEISENEDQSDDEMVSDHVIYVDEDLVKQEEFADENSDEDCGFELNQDLKQDEEELSCSFDEDKVKKEFNITDTLRVNLPKLTLERELSLENNTNLTSRNVTRNKSSNKKKTNHTSSKKQKLSDKSRTKKSLKSSFSTIQNNQPLETSQSNTTLKQRISAEVKPQNRSRSSSSNKRHSLRLSGRSPEIKLLEDGPSVTRSGKKRIYEEPKSKSSHATVLTVDDNIQRSNAEIKAQELEFVILPRVRPPSPSPSVYRKTIEVMFVCQCCDEKYASLEQVKAHIRTHFPNCRTN